MARIASVNIPDNKRVVIALTYIYGIGPSISQKILAATKINADSRVKDLAEDELNRLRAEVDAHYEVEGDLAQRLRLNINRLREINSYRGLRHKAGLPVRGQRTKTNARTKRGRRATVGSGRSKVAPKT